MVRAFKLPLEKSKRFPGIIFSGSKNIKNQRGQGHRSPDHNNRNACRIRNTLTITVIAFPNINAELKEQIMSLELFVMHRIAITFPTIC